MIVLQVTEGGVTVAEANYRVNGGAGMVYWGRAVKGGCGGRRYFITRYPENYTPPDDPSAGTEIGSGSLGSLMWKLTGAGTLTISGSGAMTDFGGPSDTPWKDHMDKITSIVIEDGVTASLPDRATVKIVDNHKDFTDVPSRYWGAEAIAFVSARELFAGTTEATFAPEAPMTRAMLMMVLARLDGADITGGGTWYEKGVAWAVARGVSGGSSPGRNITREQLLIMLWRYAGSPAAGGAQFSLGDADQISGYTREAASWAVENGIAHGFGNGQLSPQGQAARAQVAQMLRNFVERSAGSL